MMDHSRHTPLTASELREVTLEGAVIYGPGDERVGTVSHVHGVGTGMRVIVDVGGFLGIGTKPVALEVEKLNFMRDETGTVHATTTMSREQAKELPEHRH